MKADVIRDAYVDFFKKKGHAIVQSDSLVPADDPTLLFTGAGMNQFKEQFLGKGKMDFTRTVSCQKCLRTPDIEKVGKTSKHHTFFEMLGNFSFGDYFKKEAIEWAWQFLIEVMKLPKDRLLVSVYEDDDEAYGIWNGHIGLAPDKICKFGESENFWPANAPSQGPNGVCGPCSEIFLDQGPDVGCKQPDCNPSCDCDRFVEIWNLVFTQFERQEGGILKPLPRKNIDTGMGLERMAAVMQGVKNNFDTDLFVPIMNAISETAGIPYDSQTENGARIRRIADHIRAVTFCISDGVIPSNEGRGYVERRLIRRAVLDAKSIGCNKVFLYKLIPVVADVMKKPYPELVQRRENMAKIIQNEEERFHQTLDQGSSLLDGLVEKLKKENVTELDGKMAFKLYDTYGFPVEMTQSLLSDRGFSVNMNQFKEEMEKQRELARGNSSISSDIFITGPLSEIKKTTPATKFLGYEMTRAEASVLAIIKEDEILESVDSRTKKEFALILDKTPFYGESGGQVGDIGTIEGEGFLFEVTDSKKKEDYMLHIGKIKKGAVKVGDDVAASIDEEARRKTAVNHTATHLLHYALRKVLGTHVTQAGSLVASDRLRFDYTHVKATTRKELDRIEEIVNDLVGKNPSVRTYQTSIEDARSKGVMALFGEKYGQTVRVVQIGDFSKELCGGTHVHNLADARIFKIISEEAVAAGVRRITAVTADEALKEIKRKEDILTDLSQVLKTPPEELEKRIQNLQQEIKKLKKDLQTARQGGSSDVAGDILKDALVKGDTKIASAVFKDYTPDDLRRTFDAIKSKEKSVAAVLISTADAKVNMIIGLSKDLVDRGLNAGKLIKELAGIVGGGGGGKPDLAQAGGTRPDKAQEAIDAALQKISEQLKA